MVSILLKITLAGSMVAALIFLNGGDELLLVLKKALKFIPASQIPLPVESRRQGEWRNIRIAAAPVAERLTLYLKGLEVSEPHHICVTGNKAVEAVDSFVLQGAGVSQSHFDLTSKINPDNKCTVKEAQVGNTLFTITPQIHDRCAARWRAHSLTCDVLFHAHSGEKCDELFKFRLINDNCQVDMLVLHDSPAMSQCFEQRVKAHQNMFPDQVACPERLRWMSTGSTGIVEHVASGVMDALTTSAPVIRAMSNKTQHLRSMVDHGIRGLRQRLYESAALNPQYVVNMHDEILKMTQSIPVSKKVMKTVKGMLKMSMRRLDEDEAGGEEGGVALVVDHGDTMIKAGFAGDYDPSAVFPSVVGYKKQTMLPSRDDGDMKEVYVGSEALSNKAHLNLQYPIDRGLIVSWDAMKKIWDHTFSEELRVAPEEHPVLLTESPFNVKRNREKMTEIMFEKYSVPALYVAKTSVLAMHSSGRTTGVVLDSGDGATYIVPIYEGYALIHCALQTDISGRDLTEYMLQLLQTEEIKRGQTEFSREIAKDIKEKLSYVAVDFDANQGTSEAKKAYTLPNGKVIEVGDELFKCPEIIFDPSPISTKKQGIHEALFASIMKSDVDLRSDFYANIILAGGNTMFPGMKERLEKEMKNLAPPTMRVQVIAPGERKFSSWIGGSVIASLQFFQKQWITKEEYDNFGPQIVHRKCF